MSRITIIHLSGIHPDPGPLIRSPEETALWARPNLRAWFDVKAAQIGGDSRILSLTSQTTAAGRIEQILRPPTAANAPRFISTTDAQSGALMGLITIDGKPAATERNRALIGSAPFVLPNTDGIPDDFTMMWLGAHAETHNGVIWSTNDLADPITAEFTSTGQGRVYAKRTNPTRYLASRGPANDGRLHLWAWSYERDPGIVRFHCDGAEVARGTLPLDQYQSDPSIRFGAATAYNLSPPLAIPARGMHGYMEMAALFSGADPGDWHALHAVVAQRHPTLMSGLD